MFKQNDNVIVKTLQELIDSKDLTPVEDAEGVFYNKATKFVAFDNFKFWGLECTIQNVDEKDADIPYFLSLGIWVPEFMLKTAQRAEVKQENKLKIKDIIEKPKKKDAELKPEIGEVDQEGHLDDAAGVDALIVQDMALDQQVVAVDQAIENKPYVNKFTGKPFGKLFLKLIKLDEKVSEFSNTAFSKLKKHELQYIAGLLQKNGVEVVDYRAFTQKELAEYCYHETLILNV